MKTRMRAANDNPGGRSAVALPAAPVAATGERGPSLLERAIACVERHGADVGGALAFAALLAASIAIRAWPV